MGREQRGIFTAIPFVVEACFGRNDLLPQPYRLAEVYKRTILFYLCMAAASSSELLTWFCEAQENLVFFGHRCGL